MSNAPVLYVRIDRCPRCTLPRYKLTKGGKDGAFGRLFHLGRCSIVQGRKAAAMRADLERARKGTT